MSVLGGSKKSILHRKKLNQKNENEPSKCPRKKTKVFFSLSLFFSFLFFLQLFLLRYFFSRFSATSFLNKNACFQFCAKEKVLKILKYKNECKPFILNYYSLFSLSHIVFWLWFYSSVRVGLNCQYFSLFTIMVHKMKKKMKTKIFQFQIRFLL